MSHESSSARFKQRNVLITFIHSVFNYSADSSCVVACSTLFRPKYSVSEFIQPSDLHFIQYTPEMSIKSSNRTDCYFTNSLYLQCMSAHVCVCVCVGGSVCSVRLFILINFASKHISLSGLHFFQDKRTS